MKRTAQFCSLLVTLFLLCACGESGLSKGKAKEIIEAEFKDSYNLFVPKKVKFTLDTPPGYKNILLLRKAGVVNVNQTDQLFGKVLAMNSSIDKPNVGDTFSITLTKKGELAPHLEDAQTFYFLSEHRHIDDIVELARGQDNQITVLFAYTSTFSDFGKGMLDFSSQSGASKNNSVKSRGKAIIVFDAFRKDYVLKSVVVSPWDREQWVPSLRTTVDQNGNKTLALSRPDA